MSIDSGKLIILSKNYIQEAKYAKQDRMKKNRLNFDVYHLRQDYSHKRQGQSREFLAKQAMAVEQITTFIQQALVDLGDWFSVERAPGSEETILNSEEVKLLIGRALDQCSFLSQTGDSVKLGLLQSLMIAKPHGQYKSKYSYYTEPKEAGGKFKDVLKRRELKVWEPKIDLVRAEDFYPDPTGRGLYLAQETYMDLGDLYKLSEGENAIYDKSEVEKIHGSFEDEDLQSARKARETGQNVAMNNYRKRVKIQEFWGSIIDEETGKVIKEDQTWTIADDQYLIAKPKDNPFWHGKSPFVFCGFIRTPFAVWPKALMDAPTQNNIAINELYNLIVDAGMMDAHGIKQIHTAWLDDETQVSDGIYAGQTLKVNAQCPPGSKALERVDTSSMSNEAITVFQLMNAEFSASALTNDLRMGVLPNRAVKATEVVEASQSITSVFTGLTKVIEKDYIEPQLNMVWANLLQHMDDLDAADVINLLGKDKALELSAMSKEERFAKLYDGFVFKVFGISRVLSKQKDFKKLTALLQTVASSDLLMEEFMKSNDMGKLLNEIIRSLDVNIDKIKISKEEQEQLKEAQLAQSSGLAGGPQPGQGPNLQSQIPQASAQESADTVESRIPRADFGGLEAKARGGIA